MVPFRPELTLEENNRILSQHRSKALIVNVTVPVNKMSSLHLVNQAVRWEAGGRSLSGRVTAVMLSEDQKNVTVFAEISDPQMSQPDRSISDAGLLSVEG